MAVDIKSLIRKIGGQEKVTNKDKAIINLANEIANGGGGGQTTNIVKCWSVYQDTITEIQKEVGEEKFVLEMSASGTEYYFTTDDQQPDIDNLSNIALDVIVNSVTDIEISVMKPIILLQSLSSHKDPNDYLTPPIGVLYLFEKMEQGQQPILTIALSYTQRV